MDYEHRTILSDGTSLTSAQAEVLNRTGELTLPDGRRLVRPTDFGADFLYSSETVNGFVPKGS